jgi:glucose dehydrogenase
MNWGSASIDPKRGILLINQSHFAWVVKLIKREDMENYDAGEFNLLNSLFPMKGSDYGAIRFPLTSPLGAPCSQTPWGSITAVDLISGKVLWSKPLGTTRDLAPIPLGLNLGTPNFGGVISTAGGVAFATGTLDKTLRGFDIESGDLLWEHRIDGLSWAPPMTYRLQNSDLQYIVFSIGGSRENNSHDKLVAFTLKE